MKMEKFEGLLPFAELARFNKKELKRYRYLKLDRFDEMYDAVIAEAKARLEALKSKQ